MIIPFTVTFFFILIVILGLKSKQSSTLSDYIYSGRKVTTPALIATLVTTWYGGINEIGIEVLYNGAVVWLYFGLFYYLAALSYAYIIAPKIIDKNYRSIPIAIYETYGKKPALISFFFILLYLIPASYLLILGQLISEIFNINQILAILTGLVVSTIYTLKGGFSSIIKTDRIQFIFMFSGFILLSYFLFFSDNYGIELLYSLHGRDLKLFDIPGNSQWDYIIMFAFLSLLTFLDPSFHQRTFSGKNLKTVQRSIVLSILCWFIFDFITISSALFYFEIALRNNFDPLSTSSPYIRLAEIVFQNHPFLMGIFFLSILSVVMSTIDSYTFLSSVTLNYDLNIILNKQTNIRSVRNTTIVVLIISFILTGFFDRALDYWYYFGTYVIVSTLFPLICALFDIKIKNVLAMMILSVLVTFVWDMLIILELTNTPSIYIGLIIGGLFFLFKKN